MSINVLASTIVIASTSYAQPVFDLAYVQPVAQVSYVQAQAQASFLEIQVTVELTTPGRVEVEVVTPEDLVTLSTQKRVSDTLPNITDTVSRLLGKTASDTFTSNDQITNRAIAKTLADIQAIVEEKQVSFGKAVVDLASTLDVLSFDSIKELADLLDLSVDQTARHFTKALEDSVTIEDVPYLLAEQLKEEGLTAVDTVDLLPSFSFPNDTTTTSETVTFSKNKNLTDEVAFLETVLVVAQKFFAEFFSEIVTITDLQALDITSQKADNILASSNGLLVMQDYCDITYFLEDYVGEARTFT